MSSKTDLTLWSRCFIWTSSWCYIFEQTDFKLDTLLGPKFWGWWISLDLEGFFDREDSGGGRGGGVAADA